MAGSSAGNDDIATLERLRAVQRYAYNVVARIASNAEPGTDVGVLKSRLDDVARSEGITRFMHESTAGTATGRIRRDQPFVLGFAPVIDDYPADITYTTLFETNAAFDALDSALARSRAFILERVRAGDSTEAVADALEQQAQAAGVTCVREELFRPLIDTDTGPRVFAVGPHIARDGIGVTWREALVVIGGDARWLDDDLPHHRRWAGRDPVATR